MLYFESRPRVAMHALQGKNKFSGGHAHVISKAFSLECACSEPRRPDQSLDDPQQETGFPCAQQSSTALLTDKPAINWGMLHGSHAITYLPPHHFEGLFGKLEP